MEVKKTQSNDEAKAEAKAEEVKQALELLERKSRENHINAMKEAFRARKIDISSQVVKILSL